jgi:hypothetical protein
MKHIIKKILKEESLKQTLKQQVKEFGWKGTAELVNGSENLLELMHINNPMDFLNLYNDLDVFDSEKFILFGRREKELLITYYKTHKDVYIDYNQIWLVLEEGFGLRYDETQSLIETWLGDIYNLRGIKVYANEEI